MVDRKSGLSLRPPPARVLEAGKPSSHGNAANGSNFRGRNEHCKNTVELTKRLTRRQARSAAAAHRNSFATKSRRGCRNCSSHAAR